MRIAIETTYSAAATRTFDLPDGKTWDDVTDWYVKWGSVFVAFNGGEYRDLGEISDISLDSIDFKRPAHSAVFAVSEHDEYVANYDELLAEQA